MVYAEGVNGNPQVTTKKVSKKYKGRRMRSGSKLYITKIN